MLALEAEGRVYFKEGQMPARIYYLDESRGSQVQDVWSDISPLNPMATERTGYPTQKPEELLERIVEASSDEDSLVLDCFCGSGTTAVVAEKLGRRWIAADLGRFAIHTTRKRLLSLSGLRPLVVENLGKYERQLWQVAEFGKQAEFRTLAYRRFILELYKAKPIEGYAWVHGVKSGAMVHVGTVDAPVTVGDVKQIAAEFRKAVGTGKDAPKSASVDVLGWDFAFELNEVALQEAALANIIMRFVRIPREVLDKRAVEQGNVKFFELAALSVDEETKDRTVTLKLTNFVIPLDDVPQEVQRVIKGWTQWVDYWAVDWNNQGDTFHNELAVAWQYFNAVAESRDDYAHVFLIVAPNVIVFERLRTDFAGGRVFRKDPLIPPDLKVFWDFDFYMRGDPERASSPCARSSEITARVTPRTPRGGAAATTPRR